jgi:hypothetical protein
MDPCHLLHPMGDLNSKGELTRQKQIWSSGDMSYWQGECNRSFKGQRASLLVIVTARGIAADKTN